MSTPTPPWVCATASAIGSSHQRSNTPNQDAISSFETDHGLAIAVADGHGGQRYPRSSIGSSLAVDVARRLGADVLRESTALTEALARLPRMITADWGRRVEEHLAENPLSSDEAETVGPDPLVAYGTTLILVLCRGEEAVALQLGDGDVAVTWDDGTVDSPMPGEPRNVGGQTTSLCLPDAADSFRSVDLRRGGSPPLAVLVATDGYANSFAGDNWDRAVMRDLHKQVAESGVDPIFAALPNWVGESAAVGGDDTSVGVVFRGGAVPAPTGSAVSRAVPTPATETDVDRPRKQRRLGVVAVPLLVVLGGGIGYLIGAREGESSAATSSTVVVPGSTQPVVVPTTDATTPPSQITEPPATFATTVPPETPPPTSPTTPPTTVPTPPTTPVVDPVAETGVVVLDAGTFRVEVDAFAASPDPISVTPSDGTAAIMRLLTTGGRWEISNGSLGLTTEASGWHEVWSAEGGRRVVSGLGFTSGRVVAVALVFDDNAEPVVEVAVFDGVTGEMITASGATGGEPTSDEPAGGDETDKGGPQPAIPQDQSAEETGS